MESALAAATGRNLQYTPDRGDEIHRVSYTKQHILFIHTRIYDTPAVRLRSVQMYIDGQCIPGVVGTTQGVAVCIVHA